MNKKGSIGKTILIIAIIIIVFFVYKVMNPTPCTLKIETLNGMQFYSDNCKGTNAFCDVEGLIGGYGEQPDGLYEGVCKTSGGWFGT